VLVTPGEVEVAELLDRLDGLILSGGGDLDPQSFGGTGHEKNYSLSPERDESELALVRGALDAGLPLLAICRGMQVLNVALGGDLHPHLPEVVGDAVTHRISETEAATHPVHVESSSGLAEVLGATALDAVPSWHHQGVARLGSGLQPVAWAPDGVVEALALSEAPQVCGVQWHPELAGGGAHGLGLFRWLFRRAARYAATHGSPRG